MFAITYLSAFIIAVLRSFVRYSSIYVIVLVSADYLFPHELTYSWFFIGQTVLDRILDLLNITLWDSENCLNHMKNIIFVLADNQPG